MENSDVSEGEETCTKCNTCPEDILMLKCSHDLCLECSARRLIASRSLGKGKRNAIICEICKEETLLDENSIWELESLLKGLSSVPNQLSQVSQPNQAIPFKNEAKSTPPGNSRSFNQVQLPIFLSLSNSRDSKQKREGGAYEMEPAIKTGSFNETPKREETRPRLSANKEIGSEVIREIGVNNPSTSGYLATSNPTSPNRMASGSTSQGKTVDRQRFSPMKSSVMNRRPVFCSSHPDEEVSYYCFTCNTNCICPECIIHGIHKNHEVQTIRKAYPIVRGQLREFLGELENPELAEGRNMLLRFKEGFAQSYNEGVTGLKSSFRVEFAQNGLII